MTAIGGWKIVLIVAIALSALGIPQVVPIEQFATPLYVETPLAETWTPQIEVLIATPTETVAATATETLVPTDTPSSTMSPSPTDTLSPTDTPIPSSTPIATLPRPEVIWSDGFESSTTSAWSSKTVLGANSTLTVGAAYAQRGSYGLRASLGSENAGKRAWVTKNITWPSSNYLEWSESILLVKPNPQRIVLAYYGAPIYDTVVYVEFSNNQYRLVSRLGNASVSTPLAISPVAGSWQEWRVTVDRTAGAVELRLDGQVAATINTDMSNVFNWQAIAAGGQVWFATSDLEMWIDDVTISTVNGPTATATVTPTPTATPEVTATPIETLEPTVTPTLEATPFCSINGGVILYNTLQPTDLPAEGDVPTIMNFDEQYAAIMNRHLTVAENPRHDLVLLANGKMQGDTLMVTDAVTFTVFSNIDDGLLLREVTLESSLSGTIKVWPVTMERLLATVEITPTESQSYWLQAILSDGRQARTMPLWIVR